MGKVIKRSFFVYYSYIIFVYGNFYGLLKLLFVRVWLFVGRIGKDVFCLVLVWKGLWIDWFFYLWNEWLLSNGYLFVGWENWVLWL